MPRRCLLSGPPPFEPTQLIGPGEPCLCPATTRPFINTSGSWCKARENVWEFEYYKVGCRVPEQRPRNVGLSAGRNQSFFWCLEDPSPPCKFLGKEGVVDYYDCAFGALLESSSLADLSNNSDCIVGNPGYGNCTSAGCLHCSHESTRGLNLVQYRCRKGMWRHAPAALPQHPPSLLWACVRSPTA